ncbi:metallophosphoesterase family protein, partial [Acinetobacter sp. ULE_I010]|uniref:metallophosphoesterase family protein n=1 Tax=Acinetobacter sp. ULE_I010 TaxID=3373065 RepID=UPI003AF658A3
RYLKYMQQCGVDFYHIPGNHDNLSFFPFHTPEPGPTVIELGQWVFVLLNSAVQGQTDGWIQTEQLHHLQQILLEHSDKHVVI